jgi:alcohol dehydrogenase YqhD (iron-dependent ADH family)
MYNPTRLHFGRGVLGTLGETARQYGSHALFVYGKGSVLRNGVYEQVMEQLRANNIEVSEYSGIKSNPVITDVDAAAALAREADAEFIIAAGGGSVIDSAKFISLAAPIRNKAWDILEYKVKPRTALPLIAILTLAATGTEMNPFAVVQNQETMQKPGYYSPLIFPKHSFLDPTFTLSVPRDYTAWGIMDMVAHCLESYFGKGDASLTDRFTVSIILEAMEYGPALLAQLDDYDLREKIMFAASCALNGMTLWGREGADWGAHGIGHTLSVLYDVPHGASLSVSYPAWLKYHLPVAEERIASLGLSLFGKADAVACIKGLEAFFIEIGCPVRLAELGISANDKQKIISNLVLNQVSGSLYKLDESSYGKICDLMLQG